MIGAAVTMPRRSLRASCAAVHGRTAIGEYFSRVFATRRLTFTFTASNVEVVGDVVLVTAEAHPPSYIDVSSGGRLAARQR